MVTEIEVSMLALRKEEIRLLKERNEIEKRKIDALNEIATNLLYLRKDN